MEHYAFLDDAVRAMSQWWPTCLTVRHDGDRLLVWYGVCGPVLVDPILPMILTDTPNRATLIADIAHTAKVMHQLTRHSQPRP